MEGLLPVGNESVTGSGSWRLRSPGGGGALGMEKGTDCGLTATERWLSQAYLAKKKNKKKREKKGVGTCPVIIIAHRDLSNCLY